MRGAPAKTEQRRGVHTMTEKQQSNPRPEPWLRGMVYDLPAALVAQSLPSTVGGLLVHIADHTQRHVGQAITTAKLLLALRNHE